jgi:hypothetical protein
MSIATNRMGVESIMSHAIAHNLIADTNFNVQAYLLECRLVLEDALIPDYLIEEILDEAETQGILEAMMPIGDDFVDGGSSINPAYNPRFIGAVIKLQSSLKEEM